MKWAALPAAVAVGLVIASGGAPPAAADSCASPPAGVYSTPDPARPGKIVTASLDFFGYDGTTHVPGSVHFSVSGPGGTADLPSSGDTTASFTEQTPGTYTVTATWQYACPDGTTTTGTATGHADFSKPSPATFTFGGPRDGVDIELNCVERDPNVIFADEPAAMTIYWTTNGRLPTTRSQHATSTVAHGCAKESPSPADRQLRRGKLFLTVSSDSISVSAYKPTRARFLLVATSGGTPVAAMRAKMTPAPVGPNGAPNHPNHYAIDAGPCPVTCTKRFGTGN